MKRGSDLKKTISNAPSSTTVCEEVMHLYGNTPPRRHLSPLPGLCLGAHRNLQSGNSYNVRAFGQTSNQDNDVKELTQSTCRTQTTDQMKHIYKAPTVIRKGTCSQPLSVPEVHSSNSSAHFRRAPARDESSPKSITP